MTGFAHGSKLFPLRVYAFSEGSRTILKELHPLKMYPFPVRVYTALAMSQGLPGGIKLITRVGYAMLLHPLSEPQISLHTAGSEQPTVSEDKNTENKGIIISVIS